MHISLVLLLFSISTTILVSKASDYTNLNSTYEPLNRLVEDFEEEEEGLDLEQGIAEAVTKNPTTILDFPEIQYSYFKEMHSLASEVKNYTAEIKTKINWHLTYNTILWITLSGGIGLMFFLNLEQNHKIAVLSEEITLLLNYTKQTH